MNQVIREALEAAVKLAACSTGDCSHCSDNDCWEEIGAAAGLAGSALAALPDVSPADCARCGNHRTQCSCSPFSSAPLPAAKRKESAKELAARLGFKPLTPEQERENLDANLSEIAARKFSELRDQPVLSATKTADGFQVVPAAPSEEPCRLPEPCELHPRVLPTPPPEAAAKFDTTFEDVLLRNERISVELAKVREELAAVKNVAEMGENHWRPLYEEARAKLEEAERERDHYRSAGELLVGAEEERQAAEQRIAEAVAYLQSRRADGRVGEDFENLRHILTADPKGGA